MSFFSSSVLSGVVFCDLYDHEKPTLNFKQAKFYKVFDCFNTLLTPHTVNKNKSEDFKKSLSLVEQQRAQDKIPVGICVSNPQDIKLVSNKIDFLYLVGDVCRQTDTLENAAKSGMPLILEKSAFLPPNDVERMIAKLVSCDFALVECGSFFGYSDRILDPRSLYYLSKQTKNIGLSVCDLIEPEGFSYTHKASWLSKKEHLHSLFLTGKSLGSSFYVYKKNSHFSLEEFSEFISKSISDRKSVV